MRINTLFLCIFILQALTGCAGLSSLGSSQIESPQLESAKPAAPPFRTAERSPELIFQALAAAGIPYQRGGQSHTSGFDCSGLVAHVYREAFGLVLPHNALAQSQLGDTILREALQPGDLVFYNTQGQAYSHVGIYLGDDKFIHAPKPGSAVRVESMSGSYWKRRYNGARRIASL
jgi:cell wall-associated NlpC family hydrolase